LTTLTKLFFVWIRRRFTTLAVANGVVLQRNTGGKERSKSYQLFINRGTNET